MEYQIPFKKHITDKKKLFLKTLQEMLAKNETKKYTVKSKRIKEYIKINGRKRLVHTGKKGGKYYLKDKKKHYISKDTKLITGMKGGCSMCLIGGGGIDLNGALTAAGLFMFSKMLNERKTIKKIRGGKSGCSGECKPENG